MIALSSYNIETVFNYQWTIIRKNYLEALLSQLSDINIAYIVFRKHIEFVFFIKFGGRLFSFELIMLRTSVSMSMYMFYLFYRVRDKFNRKGAKFVEFLNFISFIFHPILIDIFSKNYHLYSLLIDHPKHQLLHLKKGV